MYAAAPILLLEPTKMNFPWWGSPFDIQVMQSVAWIDREWAKWEHAIVNSAYGPATTYSNFASSTLAPPIPNGPYDAIIKSRYWSAFRKAAANVSTHWINTKPNYLPNSVTHALQLVMSSVLFSHRKHGGESHAVYIKHVVQPIKKKIVKNPSQSRKRFARLVRRADESKKRARR